MKLSKCFPLYWIEKKGLFNFPSKYNKYITGVGWEVEKKEIIVIGEIGDLFIYKENNFEKTINKDRLISWKYVQLNLF